MQPNTPSINTLDKYQSSPISRRPRGEHQGSWTLRPLSSLFTRALWHCVTVQLPHPTRRAKKQVGTSLVVQWLRMHLPMQGTPV